MSTQNFANHTRYVLGYHGITFGLLVVVLAWSVKGLLDQRSADAAVRVVMALGLVGVFFYARLFALAAQNRIIRLEETLRMGAVLPDDLKGQIGRLTAPQLIALRFASDEELPDLVRRTLGGELPNQKAIKQAVKNWRPDYLRV